IQPRSSRRFDNSLGDLRGFDIASASLSQSIPLFASIAFIRTSALLLSLLVKALKIIHTIETGRTTQMKMGIKSAIVPCIFF
ncbi:MAG: hypothetical protein K2M00_07980, partial [Muribaculaceae bacterium]|nr:hypothetical protein [Muribaculaceae bacterium]